MCDLVNFVLKCTGCDLTVDVHDINDPDNAVGKLTDLQDEYQAQRIHEYPLISKAKGSASLRATISGFFETLISTCHATGLLYSDLAIIENIDVWVSTMSSSSIRPFRHTATVISLAIGSALCHVANELTEHTAKTIRQKEGEQKKKSVNKGRVKELESKIADGERKRGQVVESVQAVFDTVFVHRYRDVDPKIRVECMSALGTWITRLPDVFFEGIYLRYLGWVLSDTFAPTRAEVVRQLQKLFRNKDNVARLRQFTERFRGRLVEMSVRDSEIGIRVATVELLDTIRKTGLLEPDDIDTVGKLVFDTEPRVRKAVAGFFAENINDLFEATLEEIGGEEGILEILGEEVDDDYDAPRMTWLKLKCIADAVQSYDQVDEIEQTPREPDALNLASTAQSRYALAAQTIGDGIQEAREWEVLAGYLLFDFSTAEQNPENVDSTFKERCKLGEKEELLLLELLHASVKSRLLEAAEGEADKKGRMSKAHREQLRNVQEATAIHLASVIPMLLKKFGPNPTTASAVLRLEHVLNLEIFQKLRQDSTTYASLLDDINRQFLGHSDQGVLTEASNALLHAREFEDLQDVTGSKLSQLWDETIHSLRSLLDTGISENLASLSDTVRRIANLAGISDCIERLDREDRTHTRKNSTDTSIQSTRRLLLDLLQDPVLDSEAGEETEQVLLCTMKALLFYYMWRVRFLRILIGSPNRVAIFILVDRQDFSESLVSLLQTYHKTSTVHLAAAGTLLDLHTLFSTFRHVDTGPSPEIRSTIETLPLPVPAATQALILSTYTTLEKSFAKKSRKTLEAAPDDDLASDPEDSSDDEDEGEETQQEKLVAERQLCELAGKMVLAIMGHALDYEGPNKGRIKERLQRNRTKLGNNFKEVVAYLDEPKVKRKKKVITKKNSKPVHEEDDESDEELPQHEEGGEEDLRARELVEDRIVDADDEDEDARSGANDVGYEDEIMGD